MAWQRFLADVREMLGDADDLEIDARTLATEWVMHPSTVRTWLYYGWHFGDLDRRKVGRSFRYFLPAEEGDS